jgi:hypothetical protein
LLSLHFSPSNRSDRRQPCCDVHRGFDSRMLPVRTDHGISPSHLCLSENESIQQPATASTQAPVDENTVAGINPSSRLPYSLEQGRYYHCPRLSTYPTPRKKSLSIGGRSRRMTIPDDNRSSKASDRVLGPSRYYMQAQQSARLIRVRPSSGSAIMHASRLLL